MNFNFFNPVRMITGENCVREHASEFRQFGASCLIVTSGSAAKKSGALADVTAALDSVGIRYLQYDKVEPNPSLLSCVEAGKIARDNALAFVVGIGGGSPIDAAKATAVFAANDMPDPLDIYKMDWKNPALPIIAVGTTAGTGSEAASFSVLTRPDGRKKAFASAETYPKIMFGDARYTATLPLRFTISTALDALSHALESYFSLAANGITSLYATRAIEILSTELEELRRVNDISELTQAQRDQLYLASILAGVTLSQCGTLYCHTLGYYLTEEYDVPHGFACAAFLPDLVRRGVKYAPDRAERLFRLAQTSEDALCGLIESLCELPEIKISADLIARLVREGMETKNFKNTPPNGFAEAEAVELMTMLFGE